MTESIIYALDFDGVICDSAVETGMAGWKAASEIWNDMPDNAPDHAVDQFRQVRPIIETGYEAILAMRLLFLGESCEDIYTDFAAKSRQLIQETGVNTDTLKALFGETRDRWIAEDLSMWVAMNPLFPGIRVKLQRLAQTNTWYIVTTKQERFVRKILNANAIELAADRIFGLDRSMKKPEVLHELLKAHPNQTIEFLEDRLPALLDVRKHPELNPIELSFAAWGYNTADDQSAAKKLGISLLDLKNFVSI